jgi:hypothetical protein
MSINQQPATARLPQILAPKSQPNASQSAAPHNSAQQLAADVRTLGAALGSLGLLILCGGIALAVFCAAWAIQADVPYPIALAVGYCTVACTACLCAVLVPILSSREAAPKVIDKPQPNYAAWNHVKTFRVSDASRLWCDIEPGCAASQESLAWSQAMLAAIKSGQLPVCKQTAQSKEAMDRERANPNWATEIERAALKTWADTHGHLPRFLHG